MKWRTKSDILACCVLESCCIAAPSANGMLSVRAECGAHSRGLGLISPHLQKHKIKSQVNYIHLATHRRFLTEYMYDVRLGPSTSSAGRR
jgi:hypothetical protein